MPERRGLRPVPRPDPDLMQPLGISPFDWWLLVGLAALLVFTLVVFESAVQGPGWRRAAGGLDIWIATLVTGGWASRRIWLRP